MRDALELEWAGVPSVAIIADALVGSAEAMKQISGMPDYEYAIVPYPVVDNTEHELRAKARTLAPRVVELLTK